MHATRHRPNGAPTSWPPPASCTRSRASRRTSVQDITNRVGVTRSLFYHYFPDKEAVTSAVLDDYIGGLHRSTALLERERASRRHRARARQRREATAPSACSRTTRSDAALASRENAALYLEFVNRVADRAARLHRRDHRARLRGRCTRYGSSTCTRRSTCLSLGIVGYLRTHPDATTRCSRTSSPRRCTWIAAHDGPAPAERQQQRALAAKRTGHAEMLIQGNVRGRCTVRANPKKGSPCYSKSTGECRSTSGSVGRRAHRPDPHQRVRAPHEGRRHLLLHRRTAGAHGRTSSPST